MPYAKNFPYQCRTRIRLLSVGAADLIDGSRSLALGLTLIMPQLQQDAPGLHVNVVLALQAFQLFSSLTGLLRVRHVVNR